MMDFLLWLVCGAVVGAAVILVAYGWRASEDEPRGNFPPKRYPAPPDSSSGEK